MAETVDMNKPMEETEVIEQRDDGAVETVYTMDNDGNIVPVETMVEPTGAATQQEAPGADNREDGTVYKTQKEVDAAFGARLNAERKKFQPDISLAKALRSAFNGKSDDEIRKEIQKLQTSNMVERGIPEAVAEEFVSMRMGGEETVAEEEPPATITQPDNRTQQLAKEASDIETKYGVNMAEVLANNIELQNKVFRDGISMTEAYIMHLRAEKVANPRPKSVTPMRNANGAGPVNSVENMSEEQFEKMWEASKAGKKIIF